MAVSLKKGGNVSLTKIVPSLKQIEVGLGWDHRRTDGAAFDLDASIFMLTGREEVKSDEYFIFYNNLKSPCGSVTHQGDNRTGAGEGDDEVIRIILPNVPEDINKIVVTVTIDDAEARRQCFGDVRNAYMRVVNQDDGQEIARYDLSEEAGTEVSMIFGEIYRHQGEWKFRAVGQGFAGGLEPLCIAFGVNVG